MSDTRLALAQALKAELAHTELARVKVVQICRRAGITRQSFYYHFADVLDLAVWTFQQEVANHIFAHANLAQWSKGFAQLLTYLQHNRKQTYAVIRSLNLVDVEQFFYDAFRRMMEAIVSEVGAQMPQLRSTDRRFVVDHFTLSVLGHFFHWLATGMEEDPHKLAADLRFILDGGVKQALQRLAAAPLQRGDW